MVQVTQLEQLKQLIDEDNYPYFEDAYLQSRIDNISNANLLPLARELCIAKSSIEQIKLGDITIPSPKQYFLSLAHKFRTNHTGVVKRADEY